MRIRTERLIGSLVACVLLLGFVPVAQAQVTVEVSGGMGLTAVDLDQWSNAFARSGRDWSKTNHHIRGLVLPFTSGKFSLGGEFASQDLFWYTYNACPGCGSFVEGTTAVGSTSVMGSGRLDVGHRSFVDFGAGMFFVGGETRMGAAGAVGHSVPVNEKVSIPIKFRTDIVFGQLVAPAVSVGVSFKLQ
jgi:hypothetical protein